MKKASAEEHTQYGTFCVQRGEDKKTYSYLLIFMKRNVRDVLELNATGDLQEGQGTGQKCHSKGLIFLFTFDFWKQVNIPLSPKIKIVGSVPQCRVICCLCLLTCVSSSAFTAPSTAGYDPSATGAPISPGEGWVQARALTGA